MKRIWLFILIAGFFIQFGFSQSIVINEIMSLNETTVQDEDGDFSDWVEIYNNASTVINLAGYKLSDDIDIPEKWTFPNVEILPGNFVLVFTSGKNRLEGPFLHTNFSLHSYGEDLLLTDNLGNLVDHILPIVLQEDISYGRKPDGGTSFIYFDFPTPGTTNEFSNTLSFSHNRGFYTEPFHLSITSENSEDQVFYTLDGSLPTASSMPYQGPLLMDYKYNLPNVISEIPTTPDSAHSNGEPYWHPPLDQVDKANVLRVRSYSGLIPTSNVYSYTFFVDSNIYSRYPYPVVSLITDAENFYNQDSGIYIPGQFYDETDPLWTGNYYQKGEAWERDMHIEYFEESGEVGFFQNAGVRIHGKQTRRRPQKTLRFYARNEYAKKYFDYPLLPQKDLVKYKRFLLTTTYGCWHQTIIKDVMTHDMVRHFGMDIMDHRLVIVFINGEYWGTQVIRDYQDQNHLSLLYDIDENSIDLLRYKEEVLHGSNESYIELTDYIKNNDLSIPENYEFVANQIDIENFINYQITEIYFSNYDWPASNIKFWKSSDLDNKWRWLLYDLDAGYSNHEYNMLEHATLEGGVGWPNPDWSTMFLRKLLENDSFRALFIDRFAFLLNTTFQPDSIHQKIDEFKILYEQDIDNHIYRWSFPASKTQWYGNINWALFGYATNRPCVMQDHIMEHFDLEEFGFDCESLIVDTSKRKFFKLAPNPNDGEFTIYFCQTPITNFHLSISNVNGDFVYESELSSQQKEHFISLENLKSGMYFLHLVSNDNMGTSKFLIVK